ncbi:Soyasapogenol B glucuronide galactosyltransferase [Spatholobus suberectus]|nr:Soyasapogenol B glucuronide galactosyltransferase [Spatholobus suberectus]
MDSQSHYHLHVIFLPYPTPGHMIPMIDTARLFAKHGVSVTIITTPANALTFQKALDTDFSYGYHIRTQVVPFPATQLGLPDGAENIKDSTTPEMLGKISHGISMLKDQIELLFQDLHPDCIVTDFCYPWTVESATKLGIPRIFFYSSSYFSNCVSNSIRKHRPHESLLSDTQTFTIPGLPQRIQMTPPQIQPGFLPGMVLVSPLSLLMLTALTFQKAIDSDSNCGYHIRTQVVPFPAAQVGLPDGAENIKDGTSLEMLGKISYGMSMLQGQIELLFQDLQPDYLVTDVLYPWTVESAAKLGIPRLYYFCSSYFASCATHFISKHKPHESYHMKHALGSGKIERCTSDCVWKEKCEQFFSSQPAMETKSQPQQLNVIFLPYPAPGHMNPMVDIARLFAKHGVSVTIITTPANALTFQKAIDSDSSCGYCIRTHVSQFLASQVGLPDGVENVKAITSREMLDKISLGLSMLKDQIELLFQDMQPHCVVTDMLYPWTVESAAKLGIPRLYFYSSSYFTSCAGHFTRKHKPHEGWFLMTKSFQFLAFHIT